MTDQELNGDRPREGLTHDEKTESLAAAISMNSGNADLQQETAYMEVHAHELHKAPGHGWKHYFFEFFMLFLAVFCGFLAENYRERIVDDERERQYLKSLIADLKSDQQILDEHIAAIKSGLLMMDSLITLLNSPGEVAGHTTALYYWARLAPRQQPLALNDKTFEQLKNSGSFRLISEMNTSNKIMNYYELLPLESLLMSINETEFTEYKKTGSKIFDPAILLRMETENNDVNHIAGNPALRTTEPDLLQQLCVFAVYMHGTKKGLLSNDNKLKEKGAELISYLQKEYHLE